jgi:hypothetical protein
MAETTTTTRWGTLERWSATAFLTAGVLWLLDTVLLGIELFAGVSILGTPGAVNPVLYISGLVAGIVGLLGLYPGLAGRTPRLARVSAGLVALAGVGISVLLVWFITVTLLNQPDPPGVLLILSILVAALGIIMLGIASVRTGVPSRAVGLLVLAIPATLVGGLLLVYVGYGGDSPDWTSPAIGIVMAVLLLAIGYRLRTEPVSADSAEPAPSEVRRS